MKEILTTFLFLVFLFSADASAAGLIGGRLLKADGRPLLYTEIELVQTTFIKKTPDSRLSATTNGTGNFSFNNVPPGEYDLSINFDEDPSELSPYTTFFYPNATEREDAQVFKVDDKTRINGLIFRLPPALVMRKVTVKITDLNGKPARNLMLALRDLDSADQERLGFRPYQTKTPGIYHFNGFDNRRYQIFALQFDTEIVPYRFNPQNATVIARARSPIFVLDARTANVDLILEKMNESGKIPDFNVGALFLR